MKKSAINVLIAAITTILFAFQNNLNAFQSGVLCWLILIGLTLIDIYRLMYDNMKQK